MGGWKLAGQCQQLATDLRRNKRTVIFTRPFQQFKQLVTSHLPAQCAEVSTWHMLGCGQPRRRTCVKLQLVSCVLLQDNICTAGLRTTAGSKVLDSYLPPFDATTVANLRAAGAVLVGKTNMDEFGMGSTTENSAYKVRSALAVAQVVYNLAGWVVNLAL